VFEAAYRLQAVDPIDGIGNATLVPDELIPTLLAELHRRESGSHELDRHLKGRGMKSKRRKDV
jgi:hypothetical protein